MMNKLDIEAYRQIKAPAELKEAVMRATSKTEKKKFVFNIRTISSIAACFVFLMVGIVFAVNQNARIDFSVESLPKTSAYAEADARSMDEILGIINLKSGSKIKIDSISEGFYLIDEVGEKQAIKSGFVSEREIKLGWIVSDRDGYIKVNGKEYKVVYSEPENEIEIIEIK